MVLCKKYSARIFVGGEEIIAQVCHMCMRKINPFLFSAPHIRGIKADCRIGWVGGSGSRRLRQGWVQGGWVGVGVGGLGKGWA
jgi:hypothetical protein